MDDLTPAEWRFVLDSVHQSVRLATWDEESVGRIADLIEKLEARVDK